MGDFWKIFLMGYKDRKLSFWMKITMLIWWAVSIPVGFFYGAEKEYFGILVLLIFLCLVTLWDDLHHYHYLVELLTLILAGILSIRLFVLAPIGYFSVFFLLIFAVGIIFIVGIRHTLFVNVLLLAYLFWAFCVDGGSRFAGIYDRNLILRFPYLYVCILFVFYITMFAIQKCWYQTETRHAVLERRIREEKQKLAEMSLNVIMSMYSALSAKVPEIDQHCKRVGRLTQSIAERMNLDEDTCRNGYYAGLLHEVGAIGLPDEILCQNVLTDEQYEMYKTYVTRGYQIIKELQIVDTVAEAVRSHRENYDGSGYLEGKRGEDIPILSRILALADYVDRHQRRGEPMEQTIRLLNEQKGTVFDPKCVEVVCGMLREGRI